MSLIIERSSAPGVEKDIDWEFWTGSFKADATGNNNGDDDNGDFSRHLPDEPEPDKKPQSDFWLGGFVLGAVTGTFTGLLQLKKTDKIMKAKTIESQPSRKTAIEEGLYPTDNHIVEGAAFIGPALTITIAGMVAAQKLENYLNRKRK